MSADASCLNCILVTAQCCICRQFFRRDKLWIDQEDPGYMWQGAFTLRCLRCLERHGPSMPRILEEPVDRLFFWPSVVIMGLAIKRSFCELPRRDRKELWRSVGMWQADTSHDNLNIVTCQIDGDFCSDSVLQYCPDITNHLAEFFMCRQRDCLWVGDPTQWIR